RGWWGRRRRSSPDVRRVRAGGGDRPRARGLRALLRRGPRRRRRGTPRGVAARRAACRARPRPERQSTRRRLRLLAAVAPARVAAIARAPRRGRFDRRVRGTARAGRMSFASPVWLLGLLAVPALLVFFRSISRRPARNAVAFTNIDLLADVASRPSRWRRLVPVALLALALAAAAAAMARPKATFTTVDRHSTVVLLVDVSRSMRAPH